MFENTIHTERDASYRVTVDSVDGFIQLEHFGHFGERKLSQADAVKLAWALIDAAQTSVWRTQITHNAAWFHRTEQIIARAESPLGKAKQALQDGHFGIHFRNGKLA